MIARNAWLALTWAVALVSAASLNFTLIDIPIKNSLPCDMALGKDNNIYMVSPKLKSLIRINTATDEVTQFSLPHGEKGNFSEFSSPGLETYIQCAVRADPLGNIYAITGYNRDVARFDPNTEAMTLLDIDPNLKTNVTAWGDLMPASDAMYLVDIYATNVVASYYSGGGKKFFASDRQGPPIFFGAAGLFLASNGVFYLSTCFEGSLIQLNFTSGAFKSCNPEIPEFTSLCYIRAESHGLLWIADGMNGGVTAVNVTDCRITAPLGPDKTGPEFNAAVLGETVDGRGNVWYSGVANPSGIGFINAKTRNVTAVNSPPQGSAKRNPSEEYFIPGIQFVKSMNRIYFAQPQFNRVAYFDVATWY